MNVLLILLFINFLWGWTPQPLFAAQGTVSISAFVPGETYATTTFNSSSGGTYTFSTLSNNSAAFSFPPDFYNESLKLQTNSYPKTFFATSKPAPSGKSFIGKTYDFDLFTASSNQVTAVNKAITISFTYTDADVSGMDENALAPYRWGSSNSSWQLISGSTVDTTNNKVTFSTTLFSSFALFAAPASTPPPPSSSGGSSGGSGGGGGGGGGGAGYAPIFQTSAIFRGIGYPSSKVTLLQNAQIVAVTEAGPDAKFEVDISNLSAGTYNFGVWGQDALGNRSITQTFVVTLTNGATTVISGIFLAPTIGIDKVQVKRGDILNVLGYTTPKATVSVVINSEKEIVEKIISSDNGYYLYKFNTGEVDYGDHTTHSRAATNDGNVTTDSNFVSFKVGVKNVLAAAPSKAASAGDLNNDTRVNLIDFSIMAYWYRRPSPLLTVDLNGDGKVDLVDFSILAYYWTG